FPVARMRPMHHYGGDDARSMADDNSSAFNCRCKVGGGGLSLHGLGRALDLNPVENPYETASGLVLPEAGKRFARRDGRVVGEKGCSAPKGRSSVPSSRAAGSGAVAGPSRRTGSTSRSRRP